MGDTASATVGRIPREIRERPNDPTLHATVQLGNALGGAVGQRGPRSMPWIFVVDGHGIVRAKYQGVMGSADVDVIVALIEQEG